MAKGVTYKGGYPGVPKPKTPQAPSTPKAPVDWWNVNTKYRTADDIWADFGVPFQPPPAAYGGFQYKPQPATYSAPATYQGQSPEPGFGPLFNPTPQINADGTVSFNPGMPAGYNPAYQAYVNSLGGTYQGATGGTQGTGRWTWDSNYGTYRDPQGELIYDGSMNKWGQPAGTPGPLQVSGPRGRGYATQSVGPTDWNSQITQTQSMIDALKARQQAQPNNKNKDTHWNPYSKQMDRLQNRLTLLQNTYGGQANAGTAPAWTGVMANWRV